MELRDQDRADTHWLAALDALERLRPHSQGASAQSAFSELEIRLYRLQCRPLDSLRGQYEHLAQELSSQLKKKIRLVWTGFEGEIPEKVHQVLSESLLHLIRNSLDHGVELPEARLALGKNPSGQIDLAIRWSAHDLTLILRDDGKGVDLEGVREKARKLGLDTQSDPLEYLFQPQFSTRDQASQISGRGIGLSAVRSWVTGLQGAIHARSREGGGLEFTLRLPVRLRGLLCMGFVWQGRSYWISESEFPALRQSIPEIQAVGDASFRVFRELSPVWAQSDPQGLGQWMSQVRGPVLASPLQTGPDHWSIGVLMDLEDAKLL